ncbi:hypothetical protein F2P56_021124 [Juglans regia]|uniref:Uncharacterized protein n=1 Tax=Juglans regia TaxID=51240 RepID=A0A833WMS2_JUGRE|nr:hypothetical protein F2P56_021124 [Juglans regia]
MMAKFMYLCGSLASWVDEGIKDCLELLYHDGFFRELRMGNGVLIIQHHINVRGRFMQLSEFRNGRKGLLVIPEDTNGIGWKGFAHSIRSVTRSKSPDANKGVFVDGKTMGRPFLVIGVLYASVLRSPTCIPAESSPAAEGKNKALVGNKGCQVTLGEVEGVLWAIKAQLTGVMENVRNLMIKVDKGLDLVMGLGGGLKTDEGGLKASSSPAQGTSTLSQITSITVYTDVTQVIGTLPFDYP